MLFNESLPPVPQDTKLDLANWLERNMGEMNRSLFYLGSPKTTTVTTTANIETDDSVIICNNATTAFTVTLPVASVGKKFDIKNIGAATVTVAAQSGEMIDDVSSQDIEQWESLTLQCYELTKWAIL